MGVAAKLKNKPVPRESGRYLTIDSSSKSLAFAVLDKTSDSRVLAACGKIDFPSDMSGRLSMINDGVDAIFNLYGPIDRVVIEQTIYIQSPQTSRILSYVVGHIWGRCLEYCSEVSDVEVMKWKSHIGYKNVSKAEKQQWDKEFGAAESKKIAARERKERTGKIIKNKIDNISDITDNDIIDAIAIGLWAIDNA